MNLFLTDANQLTHYILKVFLATIRLMHIEQGLSDPTTDESGM